AAPARLDLDGEYPLEALRPRQGPTQREAFVPLPRMGGRHVALVIRTPDERIERDILRGPSGERGPDGRFRPCKDLRGEPKTGEHEGPANELKRKVFDDDVRRPHTVMTESSTDLPQIGISIC